MEQPLVVDIETTSSNPFKGDLLCLGAVSTNISGCWSPTYVPDRIWSELADPNIPVVSHSTFDPRWLRLRGYAGDLGPGFQGVNGPLVNTMVMANLINENQSLDLESLALRYCNVQMDKRLKQVDNKVWFVTDDKRKVLLSEIVQDAEAFEELLAYCHRDVLTTAELYQELDRRLEEMLWKDYFWDEEVPFTGVLVDMECAGLPVDVQANEKLRAELKLKAAEQEAALHNSLGYEVNLASPKQLASVLFEKVWLQPAALKHGLDLRKSELVSTLVKDGHLETAAQAAIYPERVDALKDKLVANAVPEGFEVQRAGREIVHGAYYRKGLGLKKTEKSEKSGLPSTSTSALLTTHPDNEFIRDLLEYRKTQKVISTYLDVFSEQVHNGRLYGHFSQTGTVTGRLSSSGPNLQNIPRRGDLGEKVRSLFKGNLIVGDHSQLEVRLAAHFSQDPKLLDIYRNDRDIYCETASAVFGRKVKKGDPERDVAKTLVLALNYGAGASKLAQTLCINGTPTTRSDAQGYLDELKELYSGFFAWREAVIAEAKDKGYVTTLGGRYRRLGGVLKGRNYKARFRGERQAVNAVIQGSAADVLRRNMVETADYGHGLRLLAQVHDELVWEWEKGFQPNLSLIKEICESPGYELSVPLRFDVDFCSDWSEKGVGSVDVTPLVEEAA